eukprot:3301692-Pleurochrysis_carterae.AAC.1
MLLRALFRASSRNVPWRDRIRCVLQSHRDAHVQWHLRSQKLRAAAVASSTAANARIVAEKTASTAVQTVVCMPSGQVGIEVVGSTHYRKGGSMIDTQAWLQVDSPAEHQTCLVRWHAAGQGAQMVAGTATAEDAGAATSAAAAVAAAAAAAAAAAEAQAAAAAAQTMGAAPAWYVPLAVPDENSGVVHLRRG